MSENPILCKIEITCDPFLENELKSELATFMTGVDNNGKRMDDKYPNSNEINNNFHKLDELIFVRFNRLKQLFRTWVPKYKMLFKAMKVTSSSHSKTKCTQ